MFYTVFAMAVIVVAMEEVAWGQWFFHFETPEALRSINRQGELTFHNIQGMQGHNEFLRLAFGVGGLFGVWAGTRPSSQRFGAPFLLISWFALITGVSVFEVIEDFGTISPRIDLLIDYLSEITELLVGMSAFLFVWLKSRWFAPSALKKMGTPSSNMTSSCSSNRPGTGTSKSSAQGLSVRSLISRMCSRICFGLSPAAP